jgi:transcriptional regulator GlxA family with amidase domain
MEPRIHRVIRLMTGELCRDIPLEELAKSVNLSSSRFRHLFKDSTGLSPTQYLKVRRMQKAQELLKTTFLSVKEIMLRIGIKDQSHFTRAFRKLYGLSPVKYRSQYLRETELRNRRGFNEGDHNGQQIATAANK